MSIRPLVASTSNARANPAMEEAVGAMPLVSLHLHPLAVEFHNIANPCFLK